MCHDILLHLTIFGTSIRSHRSAAKIQNDPSCETLIRQTRAAKKHKKPRGARSEVFDGRRREQKRNGLPCSRGLAVQVGATGRRIVPHLVYQATVGPGSNEQEHHDFHGRSIVVRDRGGNGFGRPPSAARTSGDAPLVQVQVVKSGRGESLLQPKRDRDEGGLRPSRPAIRRPPGADEDGVASGDPQGISCETR